MSQLQVGGERDEGWRRDERRRGEGEELKEGLEER